MADKPNENLAKAVAAAFSIGLVVAVIAPVARNWHDRPRDDFPLSHYPMFSKRRPAVKSQIYFLGLDSEGHRIRIPYNLVGNGGLNQYRRHLKRIVRTGTPAQRDALCRALARKVKRKSSPPYDRIVRVQIVEGEYRLDDYFSAGRKAPLTERIYAEIPIKRKGL